MEGHDEETQDGGQEIERAREHHQGISALNLCFSNDVLFYHLFYTCGTTFAPPNDFFAMPLTRYSRFRTQKFNNVLRI